MGAGSLISDEDLAGAMDHHHPVIIGGCCGIGWEYIACLADALGADQAG